MSKTLTDLILFDLDKISTEIEALKEHVGKGSSVTLLDGSTIHPNTAAALLGHKDEQLRQLHTANEWQAGQITTLREQLESAKKDCANSLRQLAGTSEALQASRKLNKFLDGRLSVALTAITAKRMGGTCDHSSCYQSQEPVIIASLDDGRQLVLPDGVDQTAVVRYLRKTGIHSVTFSSAQIVQKQDYLNIEEFL